MAPSDGGSMSVRHSHGVLDGVAVGGVPAYWYLRPPREIGDGGGRLSSSTLGGGVGTVAGGPDANIWTALQGTRRKVSQKQAPTGSDSPRPGLSVFPFFIYSGGGQNYPPPVSHNCFAPTKISSAESEGPLICFFHNLILIFRPLIVRLHFIPLFGLYLSLRSKFGVKVLSIFSNCHEKHLRFPFSRRCWVCRRLHKRSPSH